MIGKRMLLILVFGLVIASVVWGVIVLIGMYIAWHQPSAYESYRRYVMENENTEEVKWSDKIFLADWMERHGLPGPVIVYKTNAPLADSAGLDAAIQSMRGDYCMKPSHLSNSIGVVVVREHKVIMAKRYRGDITKSLVGTHVNTANERRRLIDLMAEMMDVRATWERPKFLKIPPYIIIEPLSQGPEVRVFLGCGLVWGYLCLRCGSLAPEDPEPYLAVARRLNIVAGQPFVRVDMLRRMDGTIHICEFTTNPGVSRDRRIMVGASRWAIVARHWWIIRNLYTNKGPVPRHREWIWNKKEFYLPGYVNAPGLHRKHQLLESNPTYRHKGRHRAQFHDDTDRDFAVLGVMS